MTSFSDLFDCYVPVEHLRLRDYMKQFNQVQLDESKQTEPWASCDVYVAHSPSSLLLVEVLAIPH